MKAIVSNQGNLVKVLFDLEGKITVTLPGGKQVTGTFTDEELLMLAFRLGEVTKGDLTFDVEPHDFLKERHENIETLEKQSLALNTLRDELAVKETALQQNSKELIDLQDRLNSCEVDLVAARTELKDTRIALSEANTKLGIAPVEEPAAPPADDGFVVDNAETVHNERSETETETVHNERSETESETVHNERSEEPLAPVDSSAT